MFGDNGRVTFVNDRFSVAETLDIAYGGDDILLAGTGGNFMLVPTCSGAASPRT